jgi:hypothetical protein
MGAGMTKEKVGAFSDWLLKIMMPLFIAICSLVLQSAASELRELKAEVRAMRTEYQARLEQLAIDIAALKTRMEYHERVNQ